MDNQTGYFFASVWCLVGATFSFTSGNVALGTIFGVIGIILRCLAEEDNVEAVNEE